MEKKPSKELFLKSFENVEVCDDQKKLRVTTSLKF